MTTEHRDSITYVFEWLTNRPVAVHNIYVNHALRMFRRGESPCEVLKWLIENLVARADRIVDAEDALAYASRSFSFSVPNMGVPKHLLKTAEPDADEPTVIVGGQ